jgi:uncharacterized protein
VALAACCWRPLLLAVSLALVAGCASTVRVSDAPSPRQSAQPEQWRAAAELAQRHAGLSGQARADNARRIDQLLAELDDATLARAAAALPPGDPLYAFAGRALVSRGLALPRPFDAGGVWSLDARAPADADGYRPPQSAGDAAAAQRRVGARRRAGARRLPRRLLRRNPPPPAGQLLRHHRGRAGRRLPARGRRGQRLRGRPAQPRGRGRGVPQRPAAGADARAQPRPGRRRRLGHASFSLSPEDEGIAAAEYILQRGHRRALVLVGNDDNLRRSANAFRQHFEERGGSIAATLAVGEDPAALAPQLQAAAAPPATPGLAPRRSTRSSWRSVATAPTAWCRSCR